MAVPDLPALLGYLRAAGWALEDDDGRTTQWRPVRPDGAPDVHVVLPAGPDVLDYADRAHEALRTIAYVERRLPAEIVKDIQVGGADNLAVRLTPDVPPGEAPLVLAHSAISALRNYVTASAAAALGADDLVLKPRRPQRAEAYAEQTRISTQRGSFVLSLALPLDDGFVEAQTEDDGGQLPFIQVVAEPFGRKVTARMLTVAHRARDLAQQVSDGTQPLSSFGKPGPHVPNATELAALGALGGPDHDLYQMRFALSPLAGATQRPEQLVITPGQQRILGEAADFLRTKQSRIGVTVTGLVVRLFRESKLGPGEVVIQGVGDDTGIDRRYRVELTESDYADALRAHRFGLQVTASGDLDVRGTRRALRRLTSFSVLPGLEDD
ncbi:hypothetical protein [Actinomadura hibisca]|uniref:hypothetical protein n=1 Tax=Actinomadura hibisca TaxID=68565 RepID=UPI00083375B1|nr:hypothetical protein [Actinomadura hibisca]